MVVGELDQQLSVGGTLLTMPQHFFYIWKYILPFLREKEACRKSIHRAVPIFRFLRGFLHDESYLKSKLRIQANPRKHKLAKSVTAAVILPPLLIRQPNFLV